MAAPLDSTQPAIDSTAPPAPPALGDPTAGPASSLTLTSDQLAAAGLDGIQAGDSFTVTITGTVNDTSNGLTADVTMASQGEKETDEPGGDMPAGDETGPDGFTKPKGKIEMGPGGMKGF